MHHTSLFPPLPHVPEQNVHHILLDRPDQASWRDFTFQVDILTGEQRSFRQFIERVRDGATALGTGTEYGGLGLRSENNEIVGILSENCLDYVALIHSLLAIAVPFATFSSYSTSFEFQYSINLSGATRLFVSPALLHLAQVSGLPDDRIHILEGNVEDHTSYATLVDRVRQNKIPRLPVRQAKKDTLAYLVFSSGTTGLPKGGRTFLDMSQNPGLVPVKYDIEYICAVMITHGNLLTSIIQYMIFGKEVAKVQGPRVWNGPDGMQVLLNVLPIHHTYGLNVATFRCFFERVTLLFLSKWNADTFLDSIPKLVHSYRVTTLVLVPSLIYQIVHHPRFSSVDFSTVQAIQCGAAYLPVQLSERLRSQIPSVQRIGGGYGMSECTLAVSLMPVPGMLGGRARNVPGSIGMLIPGIEARVMREDGTLADINETGELYVRGGCVSPGYWRNEAATKAAFVDGWLRTGDHIRIDSDGVLYFEDRAKDTLKVSGMQVSPMEIENTIFDHPDKLVDDVTVAGISGGRTADERVPRAWVVLSPAGMQLGATEATRQIDRWVRERLSRYKWLRGGIAVVNEIPKSSTGKVLRRQLVDRYEAERTAPMARL